LLETQTSEKQNVTRVWRKHTHTKYLLMKSLNYILLTYHFLYWLRCCLDHS